MAASWWKLALALGTAGAFVALIPSCADNTESIFIRQMQADIAPACTVNSDPTALVIYRGVMDVGITTSYTAFPLVGNQLIARGDAKTNRAESNRVMIQGAEVQLRNSDGSPFGDAFRVIASGTVDPTTSSEATYGVTAVEVVPAKFGLQLRQQVAAKGFGAQTSIQADIKIFGTTVGGRQVETGSFVHPIDVCFGCTINVPPDAVSKTTGTDARNCAGPLNTGSSGGASQKLICFAGQDDLTDCRLCQGTIATCRPCSTDASCAGLVSVVDPSKGATCNVGAGFCQ